MKTKPIGISRELVLRSWEKVLGNRGAPGVDGVSLGEFGSDLRGNLYKVWNRMSSGSYFPPPVLGVTIPKKGGGERRLGIPTVSDRVAQTVVKEILEPRLEKLFDEDSYGYRPGKSAHDALRKCRQRTWQRDWVIDLDIKGFFDNIDHGLLMKAVEKVVPEDWIRLYVLRWLQAGSIMCGEHVPGERGTPQGGVVSPLLANLFLHYVFDRWMRINHPGIQFERYADDIVIHTRSEAESMSLLDAVVVRFAACKLEINASKSKVVYCRDCKRKGDWKETSFDFLGFTFRTRLAANRRGMYYAGFLPGISPSSSKAMRNEMRSWNLQRHVRATLEELAEFMNPRLRGWINYFGMFNKRDLNKLFQWLEFRLLKWVRTKHKSLRSKRRSVRWLKWQRSQQPRLFAHWAFTYTRFERQEPYDGRLSSTVL